MQASELTFGVEIECFIPATVSPSALARAITAAGIPAVHMTVGIHATIAQWKVVPDISVSGEVGFTGVEVVSPILRGADGHAQMRKVADVIKACGAKVTKACGLHVHVGAKNATVAQHRNIAKMFLRYEAQIDRLCPPSRQNNRFAQSNLRMAGGDLPTAFTKLDAARSVEQVANVMNGGMMRAGQNHYSGFRYFKLNFQSMMTHGTVEFRQQAGTIEGAKMSAWVDVVTAIVAVAMSLRVVSKAAPATFDDLCAKVSSDTAAFIRDRAARLAIPVR